MSDKYTASTPEKFAEYWDNLNPPIRPSRHMVEIYDYAIRSHGYHDSGEWGLLGCTPEVRSLAAQYDCSLTCIDRSQLAYEAFKLICTIPDEECFIDSDWVDAKCPGMFDVVIGDGSISMLHPENHKDFIENVYSMIKPGGIALLRVQVRDGCVFENPSDIINWFRELGGQRSINTSTRGYLQILWADPKTGTIFPDDFGKWIEELFKKGVLTESEYLDFNGQPMKLTVNYTTRKDFEDLVSPYFDVIGIEEPKDFLSSEHFPIYKLKRK